MSQDHSETQYVNLHEIIEGCYDDLKQRADKKMQGERKDHSWTRTVLVHEFVEKILKGESEVPLERDAFFRFAYRAMSNILIDHVRMREADKRCWHKRESLDLKQIAKKLKSELWTEQDWFEFEDFCENWSKTKPQDVEIFRMRVVFGYSNAKIAAKLGLSPKESEVRYSRMRILFVRAFGFDLDN